MPNNETLGFYGYFLDETDKAYLFALGDEDEPRWIPKSICMMDATQPSADRLVGIDIEEWWVEQEGIL